MMNMPRAVMATVLLGLVVLPAGASLAATPHSPSATNAPLRASTPADASPAPDLQTDYSWDKPGVVRTVAAALPDEQGGWPHTLVQLAPALLILTLTVLGLTITFTSLRRDIKQRRRAHYRPRGPHSLDSSDLAREPDDREYPTATARR